MNKSIQALLLTFFVGMAPAAAMAHDYTYLDGGIVDGDRADPGARFSGSVNVANPVALFGEVESSDAYSRIGAGALFHAPLNTVLDITAGASAESVDTGRDEDLGLGLRAGLRWQVLPGPNRFELSPEIRQLHVFDTVSTSVRTNALLRVAHRLDLLGAIQAGDDDRVELGMRYNFGRATPGI